MRHPNGQRSGSIEMKPEMKPNDMRRPARKTKAPLGQNEFLFVVQVAAPDGGFGCDPDAGDRCGSRSRRQSDWEFKSWCFEGLEMAKSLRHRFGGEIVPVTIRRLPERRRNPASAVQSECEGPEQTLRTKRGSSNRM
jgi:hypothetical protein